MKATLIICLLCLFSCTLQAQTQKKKNTPPSSPRGLNAIKRYDNPNAAILAGVAVPSGKDLFFSSGIVAPIADSTAEVGSPERYGDTYTQSVNVIKRIEKTLKDAGLDLSNIIFMRVYLVPDRIKFNQVDFDAWFKAYSLYFNNAQNPNKVARTTISVPALANADLLIEIEVVAAYE